MRSWLLVVVALGSLACQRPSVLAPVASEDGSCDVALALGTSQFNQAGGQTTVSVTAPGSCSWRVTAPPWTALGPSHVGRGRATLLLDVAAYDGIRTGTVTSGGQSVSVRQQQDLQMTARCFGVRVGIYSPLACTVTVAGARNPASTWNETPTADLRVFGRSERWHLASCGPCQAYDLDLLVPAGFPAGVVEIEFTVSDGEGRTGRAVGRLEVAGR
jgi:hypothetical protein